MPQKELIRTLRFKTTVPYNKITLLLRSLHFSRELCLLILSVNFILCAVLFGSTCLSVYLLFLFVLCVDV